MDKHLSLGNLIGVTARHYFWGFIVLKFQPLTPFTFRVTLENVICPNFFHCPNFGSLLYDNQLTNNSTEKIKPIGLHLVAFYQIIHYSPKTALD